MEQAREARGQEPAEAWDEVVEEILRQDRAAFAFAPTVVKEQPINWREKYLDLGEISLYSGNPF
jgi:hypothetical protein